jgi:hypothetical protein
LEKARTSSEPLCDFKGSARIVVIKNHDRLGEMLAYNVGGETRPGGEVTGIDGFGPGAGYRAETGPMQRSDEIAKSGHFVDTIDERNFDRVAG